MDNASKKCEYKGSFQPSTGFISQSLSVLKSSSVSQTSDFLHWSQRLNPSSWCLLPGSVLTEPAAACFCVVFCPRRRPTNASVFSYSEAGWADHTASEAAARKHSHCLQGPRLCHVCHYSASASSIEKQCLFDSIHQLSINPLAGSSACKCGRSKACVGRTQRGMSLIKGVEKLPESDLL